MLRRVLDVIVELFCESLSILVLGKHDSTGIEYEPPDDQHQISDNENLFGIDLVVLVHILVVRIDKFDALVLFQLRKLDE